ncbi:GntR family transcriptional regulator [Streptomyces murinus]|nr:GntR family transcriptional regulator [Streptomyces murinus]UWW91378.1 GntR family transcriptional regulator [Streptomyces murinus]
MMKYQLRRASGTPAYQQIIEQTEQALRLGILKPGDKLPTAREVVESAVVNGNTVLRAYQELQRRGLVESRTGLGTFVVGTLGSADRVDGSGLRQELEQWMTRAREHGLEREDVMALVVSVGDACFAERAPEGRAR